MGLFVGLIVCVFLLVLGFCVVASGPVGNQRHRDCQLTTEGFMKRVEALIRTHKFDAVKASLTEHGVTGMTISEVRGFGRQKGHSERYRGAEYKVDFVPKIKIDVVIPDQDLDKVVDLIATAAATGEVGDGKIFVSSLENVIRIRTLESGENAI